jgi:ABC-2 type transport system permease protein
MPAWLHGFANNQPVTLVIESVRALLLDTPVGGRPWLAAAWCGALFLASTLAAAVLFRRRTG